MTLLRRLGYTALLLGFAQVVFGAIVRITGSGMGCGDDWPKCLGHWFPPLDRIDLIIEWTHRLMASALMVVLLALVVAAWLRRDEAGVGGPRGVLRPAMLAGTLGVAAALLGAVTVFLELNPAIVVIHLVLAMTLLATLIVGVVRAGGFGGGAIEPGFGSAKTARGAMAAAGLAAAVLLLGALTANLPGAAPACQGFPLCNGSLAPSGGPAHVHMTHRILAFLLFFHLIGLAIVTQRRVEHALVVRSARVALSLVIIQIAIAAALVEMFLPATLQSLHQAVGTLVWIAIVLFAVLARAAVGRAVPADGSRDDQGDTIAAAMGMPMNPAGVERRSTPRSGR
jgi:heme A synthase